jgi:hypothetical protein
LPFFINSLSKKELLLKLQQVDDMNWSFTGVQFVICGGFNPNEDRDIDWP